MHRIVFEDGGFTNLLPLTYTRPVFDLRCGFDRLLEKMETAWGTEAGAIFVRPALADVMAERQQRPVNRSPSGDDQVWVNGRLFLTEDIEIEKGTAWWRGDTLLAARVDADTASRLTPGTLLEPTALRSALTNCRSADPPDDLRLIEYPWNLIHANEAELVRQFEKTHAVVHGRVYDGAHLLNRAAISIGPGSVVKPSTVLDAESGPIVIGVNVKIGANVTIEGPCYLGDDCLVQPGALIRGGCSFGRFCKLGGEIEGTIFHGWSNKQHDGFVGHSYVGEWVNMGADTVTSDLKNTYGPIRVPVNGPLVDSGETFVGTTFGDHTKTGINVALATGTVLGFAANIFLSRYPPKFVPSFSWLTDDGAQRNDPARALAVAKKVVARRKRTLSDAESALFLSVADAAAEVEENR